ncbi:GNAT family N-acetyltransferase [Rivularia sp. UHCC 0363]|uniref:GNAT family N-acetyltransferase n=1 Tax=Rivularia sp. UHCC 0363 TaxID=3110244 RepID=UPI002B1F2D38|nr:GNAT family N-acetyltransferase [Rivularia sp. UHCC 0363]MEA5593893.1 GNAT family N-acetyltransferase [Rivularia sp. UHCC 0363]
MNIQVIDYQNPLWLQTLRKLRYDVYHLPEYVHLEAKRTHTVSQAFVIIDNEKIFFLPFLLRSCNDILGSNAQDFSDAISPYGYPGVLLSEAAINSSSFTDFAFQELNNYLKLKGICSAFFRLHPILGNRSNQIFSQDTMNKIGETVSIDLKLSESQIWANTRKGHQSTINKCKRLGFTARMVNLVEHVENFQVIYEETMNRVAAKKSYYFDQEYFSDLLNLNENIHLCIVELDSEIAAACILFECGGIVQAHLGGTKNKFLQQSPFNYLLDYVRYWAKQRGNELMHIGSGVGGTKDSLYHFKTGFSKQRHDWFALRLIPDREKYNYLTHLRAESLNTGVDKLFHSSFFPAYRSNGT